MNPIISIGKKCMKCGADEWIFIDEKNIYKQFCNKCGNYIEHIKQDYVSKFECPDCGSLSGTLEENDFKLGVRCSNCGKLHIMLEKHTTINNRNSAPKSTANANVPKCPTCGSINIQRISASAKLGGAMMFGIFSKTAKSQWKCRNCGSKW